MKLNPQRRTDGFRVARIGADRNDTAQHTPTLPVDGVLGRTLNSSESDQPFRDRQPTRKIRVDQSIVERAKVKPACRRRHGWTVRTKYHVQSNLARWRMDLLHVVQALALRRYSASPMR